MRAVSADPCRWGLDPFVVISFLSFWPLRGFPAGIFDARQSTSACVDYIVYFRGP